MSDDHNAHHVRYGVIFIALCIFTSISVACDYIPRENKILIAFAVLAVATAKALCVMMFFMHLKFEGNWKFVLLAPTIILAMGIPLALMPDIAAHYYTVDIPQAEHAEIAHGDFNSSGSPAVEADR